VKTCLKDCCCTKKQEVFEKMVKYALHRIAYIVHMDEWRLVHRFMQMQVVNSIVSTKQRLLDVHSRIKVECSKKQRKVVLKELTK
jgi:hypothetical protein